MAFHDEIDDRIEPQGAVPGGPLVPTYVYIGEARIRGVEIEGGYESERVFGRLASTHADGEDRATGETLASQPADNLSLTLDARLPERDLAFGWTGRFVDAIALPPLGGPPPNLPRDFPGYAVHDVFVEWQSKDGPLAGLEVSAGIDNMFDKDYRNSLAGDPGPGRNFKLTVGRQFSF
jgi:hemoglobin/transferrin/lactoferrin receptor protein